MTIKANSRYLLTDVVQVFNPISGKLIKPPFVDLRQRVTGFASDDQFVTVDDASSWATLALNKLTDPRFWWVVADLSNVVDPFAEFVPSVRLRVPSVNRLLFNILAPSNTRG